jgi:hypothetical protein
MAGDGAADSPSGKAGLLRNWYEFPFNTPTPVQKTSRQSLISRGSWWKMVSDFKVCGVALKQTSRISRESLSQPQSQAPTSKPGKHHAQAIDFSHCPNI